MKQLVLLLTILTLLGGFSMAQPPQGNNQRLSQKEEIRLLKAQIENLILSSQESIRERDARLKAALQRIATLEAETQCLRDGDLSNVKKRDARRRLSKRLRNSEDRSRTLELENMRLRKQLYSLQRHHKISMVRYEKELTQAQDRLVRKDRRMLARVKTKPQNDAVLQAELARLKAHIQASKEDLMRLQTENNQLWSQLETLRNQHGEKRNELNDNLANTQEKLNDKDTEILRRQQQIDSLKYEISGLKRMVAVLNNTDKVTQQRIERIEQDESAIVSDRQRLEKQAQLLSAQEKSLSERKDELDQRENKYQDLLEKERQLKMWEQRLKQRAGSKSRGR